MNQDDSSSFVDRFLTSLQDPTMETILQNLKTLKIHYQNHDENLDLYMVEKVLPILFAGMEELSREVERFQTQTDINPEIRERFNPCIFLAQFLMRNNPKYQNNAEKQQIEDFVRKEKCMRYFKEKREEFLKLFKKSLRTDKTHCPYSDLKLFAQTLDFMYELKGDLREYLLSFKSFLHAKDEKKDIEYDDIMAGFGEYTVQNPLITLQFLRDKPINIL